MHSDFWPSSKRAANAILLLPFFVAKVASDSSPDTDPVEVWMRRRAERSPAAVKHSSASPIFQLCNARSPTVRHLSSDGDCFAIWRAVSKSSSPSERSNL